MKDGRDKRNDGLRPREKVFNRKDDRPRRPRQEATCLHCNGPIDVREGKSLPNPRGAPFSQRQGWLHDACERELSKKFFEVKYDREGRATLVKNLPLAVPTYTGEELDEAVALRAKG